MSAVLHVEPNEKLPCSEEDVQDSDRFLAVIVRHKCKMSREWIYCRFFLLSPFPGRLTWCEEQRGRTRDHTLGNPLLPPSAPSEPPPNLTINESYMLGYMVKRDDFEVEFDNDSERLVSQIASGAEDEDIDLALKVAHVDMYKFKLRERERRKRVAREHQLISK